MDNATEQSTTDVPSSQEQPIVEPSSSTSPTLQANSDGSEHSHQTSSVRIYIFPVDTDVIISCSFLSLSISLQQSSLLSDPAFSQFFERYTPPDTGNPFGDIIKDYVDWYVNVFMTREQREHWVSYIRHRCCSSDVFY
jgi:hypothetical protein